MRLTSFPSADGIAILGIGMSCDGYHPTDPCPTGEHLERAICMALSDAKLAPNDVVTVVGHGTGTAKGDRIESEVLQRIWGNALPTVTSVKGHVGHLMGAAGLFNLAVGFEACRTGFVPKTRGEVPKTVSCEKGRPTLCLASGFGGNNVALLIGRGSR